MIDKIKTLKNLNKKFPRYQLETLLTIIDCIEEYELQPLNEITPVKTPFTPPYTITCDDNSNKNEVTVNPEWIYRPEDGPVYNTPNITTTNNSNQNISVSNNNPIISRCTASTTLVNDGENTYECTYKNKDGEEECHTYVNGEEKDLGIEFPPHSKKQHHLSDKTSKNVNILTKESKDISLEDIFDSDLIKQLCHDIVKEIFE